MNIFKKIFNISSLVIVVACFGAFLLFGINGTGWKALAIPTSSMRPNLTPGSLVIIHKATASSLRVGDIITYVDPLNPKATITHRIIKTYLLDGKVPAYITKGDANKIADIPITIGSVNGKVIWHIPNAGYLLMAAREPYIILPFIYLVGVLLMSEEVKRLSDYYKLSQPYRLFRFIKIKKQSSKFGKKFAYGISAVTLLTFMIGIVITPTALALLNSDTVTLTNNQLIVAPITKCSVNTNNNTSINTENTSSQSGSTGNSTSNNNTNSGSASSGNVSNSNSSSTTVTVNNC